MVRDAKKKPAKAAPKPSSPVRSPPAKSSSAPPPPAAAVPASKPPGLLAQAASTAVGVGIGSAVGHAVGSAITSKTPSTSAAAPQTGAKPHPCDKELREYIDCGSKTDKLASCQQLFEALKKCRQMNGAGLDS